jgi:hypothetical protein
MQEKSQQSHTKTVINLSKPYHSGKLLIDIKPNNKTVIISSPSGSKVTENIPDVSLPQNTIKNPQVGNEPRLSTIFDDFTDYDKIFDPSAKSQYRNADDIQIKITQKLAEKTLSQEVNTSTENQKTDLNSVKSLTDINKASEPKQTILSKKKPQISIEPLHSKSRILATTSANRELIKKLTQKRIDLKVKLMEQKKKAALDNPDSINDFVTNNDNIDFATKESFTFKSPEKFDSSNFQFYPGFKKTVNDSDRINLDKLNGEIHNSKLRQKMRMTNKIKRYSLSAAFATVILVICTVFLTGNAQWLGQISNKSVMASRSLDKKSQKYEQWIQSQNSNKYSPPGNDLDQDGLNNFEEYLIESNPNNKNSCYNGQTDNENLINLIDPVTCKPIDMTSKIEVEKFAPILNIPSQFINKILVSKQQNKIIGTEIISSFARSSVDILPSASSQNSSVILPKNQKNLES